MKTNLNYQYLVLHTFFSPLTFKFHHAARAFSCLFLLHRFLVLHFSIKECLFRISALLYTSTTTVMFNYKKQVHPLFIFKKGWMQNGKNYFSPKYHI
jgi:hypothetical protein